MLPKSELKYIQSLSQKKFRTEYGVFIAEGPKLINELFIRKPGWAKKIYGTANWWNSQLFPIRNKWKQYFNEVEFFELEKISNLQTPQEVLAIIELPSTILNENAMENNASDWTLVLDGIQDPGNMGTIIRTAHWFGVNTIICSTDCADAFQPKVVQASMGSIFGVNIGYQNLEDFFTDNTLPVYGALLNGKLLHAEPTPEKGIIIIGNEGKGIGQELLPYINHPVTIPGYSDVESLNASIATGILLYSFNKKH